MKPIFTGNCVFVNRTHFARWKLNRVERQHIFRHWFGWLCLCGDFRRRCYFATYTLCFVSFSGIFLSFFLRLPEMWAVCELKAWKEHSHENSIAFTYPQIHLSLHNMCGIFFVLKLTHRAFFLSLQFISFHFIWFTLLIAFDTLGQWHCGGESKTTKMKWRISLEVSKQYISMLRQFHMVVQFTPFIHRQHTQLVLVVTIGDI